MNYKRVAINAAVVMGTLALVYLLWVFRQAFLLFVFSLGITAAMRPFVERLTHRGVPRTRALILVYSLFVVLIIGLVLAVGASLVNELERITNFFVQTYDRIYVEWPNGTEIEQAIVQQLPAPTDLYNSFSPERRSAVAQGLLGFTATSAGFLAQVVTVLILSIYWSIDRVHFERLWLSLLPVESRARARDMWRNIEQDFGTYVRSEVLQSFLAGLLLGIGLQLMGVKYPTLLAVFASLAWLIPYLGGVLVIIPVALAGYAVSIPLAVVASLYAVAVMFFLEFTVEPHFTRRYQFSSLFSILLIIAFIEPYGLFGFLVAPPLAAAIELIIRYNLQLRQQSVEVESATRISEIKNRLEQVRESAASSEEPVDAQTLNLLSRLEDLVEKADDVLKEERPRARKARV